MSSADIPDQMTWKHDGYTFVLDEDGLHLRIDRRGFEQCEVLALIEGYQSIRGRVEEGFYAPTPPTPQEIREMGYGQAERRAKRDVIRTLQAELAADTTNVPF